MSKNTRYTTPELVARAQGGQREPLKSAARRSFWKQALLAGVLMGFTSSFLLQPRGALAQVQTDAGVATTAVAQQLPVLNAAMSPLSDFFARGRRLNDTERVANRDAGRGENEDLTRVVLPATSLLMTRLFEQLNSINSSLRAVNGDRDVFPITGTTPQERYNSLMTWLRSAQYLVPGEPQLGPDFDQAAFERFRRLASVAINTPAREAQATQALAQLPSTRVDAGTTPIPVVPSVAPAPGSLALIPERIDAGRSAASVAVAAPPTTAPSVVAPPVQIPVVVRPAGPTTAPQVAPVAPIIAQQVQVNPPPVQVSFDIMLTSLGAQRIGNDLSLIATYHPNRNTRNQANTYLTQYNRLEARMRVNQRGLSQADQNAIETFISGSSGQGRPTPGILAFVSANRASAATQADQAIQEQYGLVTIHPGSDSARVQQLIRDLGLLATSTTPINRVLNVLGVASHGVEAQIMGLLTEAAEAHRTGNDTLANQRIAAAVQRFDEEQSLLNRMLAEVIYPTLDAAILAAQRRLPSMSVLGQFGARAVRQPPRNRGGRRVALASNYGGDGIAAYYRNLRSMSFHYQSHAQGSLSADRIFELYARTNAASRLIDRLSDAWALATANGARPSPDLANPFVAAMTSLVVPPSHYHDNATTRGIYNDIMPLFRHRYIMEVWLPRHPGQTLQSVMDNPRIMREVTASVNEMLQRQPDRLFDAQYSGVYQALARTMTLANPSAEDIAGARIRSTRSLNTALYMRWGNLANPVSRSMVLNFFNPTVVPSEEDASVTANLPADSLMRFMMARTMLEDAVADTSAIIDFPHESLNYAGRLLENTRTAPAANQVVETADNLFQASRFLYGYSEALRLQAIARRPAVPGQWRPDQSALIQAGREIDLGFMAFGQSFAHLGEIPASRHPNLPAEFMETAIRLLSPPGVNNLESFEYIRNLDMQSAAVQRDSAFATLAGIPADPTLVPLEGTANDAALVRLRAGTFDPADRAARAALAGAVARLDLQNMALVSALRSVPSSRTDAPLFPFEVALHGLNAFGAVDPRINQRVVIDLADPERFQAQLVANTGYVQPTFNALDGHPLQVNSTMQVPFEMAAESVSGEAALELRRQFMLHADHAHAVTQMQGSGANRREVQVQIPEGTPQILRILDVAPARAEGAFGVRLREIATALQRDTGFQFPADRSFLDSYQDAVHALRSSFGATNFNETERARAIVNSERLLIGILEARIAHLEFQLSQDVTLPDGTHRPRRELAMRSAVATEGQNINPAGMAITNALEILDTLRTRRDQLLRTATQLRADAASTPAAVLNRPLARVLRSTRELILLSEDASVWAAGEVPFGNTQRPATASETGTLFGYRFLDAVRTIVQTDDGTRLARFDIRAMRAGRETRMVDALARDPEAQRNFAQNVSFEFIHLVGRGDELYLQTLHPEPDGPAMGLYHVRRQRNVTLRLQDGTVRTVDALVSTARYRGETNPRTFCYLEPLRPGQEDSIDYFTPIRNDDGTFARNMRPFMSSSEGPSPFTFAPAIEGEGYLQLAIPYPVVLRTAQIR